ncbi:MAG: thiol reductase thioredoxin [Candidatus Aenigmatarchaeota archaeon]|nr:MAG: thiol reductase thioredoxin [Candidatus Aenigmarchaeota archaeon]
MITLKDFYADWCAPCKKQEKVIKKVLKEFNGHINLEKINVEERPEEASKYSVLSLPTLVIEKEGKICEKLIGFTSAEKLKEILNKTF